VKWRVFFDPAAEKQFSKLGKSAQRDIEKYIAKHLESVEDPRRFGKPHCRSRERGVIAWVATGWCA
jgi:mRNA-degrading endonuclease RelE of RelBE toxin-antitoxin system